MWASTRESHDTASSVAASGSDVQFDPLHSSPGEPSTTAMAGLNVNAPTPPTVLRMDKQIAANAKRVVSSSPTLSHDQPRSSSVWTYDTSTSRSPNSTTSHTTNTKANSVDTSSSLWSHPNGGHGVLGATYIHNHVNQSRLLWNHTAREEEEREEEALPSYLSYLQPRFRPSSSPTTLHSPWMSEDPSATTSNPRRSLLPPPSITTTNPPPSLLSPSPFTQRPPWPSTESSHSSPSSSFPMETPVEMKSKELAFALQEFVRQQVEQQSNHVPTVPPSSTCQCLPLQQRVNDLEQKLTALQQVVSSMASPPPIVTAPPLPRPVTTSHPPPFPPTVLPPPFVPTTNTNAAASTTPPPPPPPPPSTPTPTTGVMDRVSTLEGRQSAFQSQLAQISKVLGIPVGKQHKNASIKTLVQTLREEIDNKIQSAIKEISLPPSPSPTSSAPSPSPASGISYEAVLSALSEEHEASLSKLRGYLEDRLTMENRQRVSLESRIQRRLSEYEEWLQQLEGEFGSWHDQSASVASQVQTIQQQVHEMSKGIGNTELFTRSLHQLQTHYRQLQTEFKTETITNRESMALMESWVQSTRQETRELANTVYCMQPLLDKVVKETDAAEGLLQQYVSTITHQVASVTRQYVSVRLQENKRWIDTTLRSYVPEYGEKELDKSEKNQMEEENEELLQRMECPQEEIGEM